MGGHSKRGAERYVALLRGINVGGKNPLPMKALTEIFQLVGCRDVRTYIQSGNVVFSAGPILAKHALRMVSEEIEQRFSFRTPILTRSSAELAELANANPFRGKDPKTLHLLFLADSPSLTQIAKLDTKRSEPDAFAVCGANIFLYLPNGVAKSKLGTSYFERALTTTATQRNWNTVQKLVEWSGEPV